MFQVINNRYQEHPEHRAGAVKKVCTPQLVGDITGLKVCGQAQLSSKALAYPFRATVTLEKADPTLQSYDFLVEADTTVISLFRMILILTHKFCRVTAAP